MIKLINNKIKQSVNGGLFHDSRGDIRALSKMCNELIDKVNELTDKINELDNNRKG